MNWRTLFFVKSDASKPSTVWSFAPLRLVKLAVANWPSASGSVAMIQRCSLRVSSLKGKEICLASVEGHVLRRQIESSPLHLNQGRHMSGFIFRKAKREDDIGYIDSS